MTREEAQEIVDRYATAGIGSHVVDALCVLASSAQDTVQPIGVAAGPSEWRTVIDPETGEATRERVVNVQLRGEAHVAGPLPEGAKVEPRSPMLTEKALDAYVASHGHSSSYRLGAFLAAQDRDALARILGDAMNIEAVSDHYLHEMAREAVDALLGPEA